MAVDRRFKSGGEATADFISCVAFGRTAEFAEKYLHKGTKIAVTGRIQTGSYTNKDGHKVYTTDVVIEEHEFAESKAESAGSHRAAVNNTNNSSANGSSYVEDSDGFMSIPDGIDEELPFS